MLRMRFSRSSDSTTEAGPFAGGTAPPHSPVRPPAGTMASPWAAQRLTTSATCSVLFGFTTATGVPL